MRSLVAIPNGCGLLQLREEVEPDLLYRRYFYRSATSDMMRNDLKDVIADITSRVDLKAERYCGRHRRQRLHDAWFLSGQSAPRRL